MALLTNRDKLVLQMSRVPAMGGFSAFTKHYFGWEPMYFQWVLHHVSQPNVTAVHGIGTGKTEWAALSELADCVAIPYYSCLHTSTTTPQAELAFIIANRFIELYKDFAKFVSDIRVKPYPTIMFHNGSRATYRTVGFEARNIRGDEFDRIVFDEAGYEEKETTIKTLRGRLRGKRPDGTARGLRLDCISTPTDVEWLIRRFNAGWKEEDTYEPRRFYSQRVSTFENIHLTEAQLEELTADYPEELARVELNGFFPDYGLAEFSRSAIENCTDSALNDLMEINAGIAADENGTKKSKPGWDYVEHARHGCLKWEEPVNPNRPYLLAGDPGTDGPPRRNAGAIMCFDIKEKMRLVYFHWVEGGGSYMPFLSSYKYALEKYQPLIRGMDTTGTQKAIDELAFENQGLVVDRVNFQDKDAMLNSLKFALSNIHLQFPFIKGLRRQLREYQRKDEKIPQDLIACLMQATHLRRFAPGAEKTELENPIVRIDSRSNRAGYDRRSNRAGYDTRSRRG